MNSRRVRLVSASLRRVNRSRRIPPGRRRHTGPRHQSVRVLLPSTVHGGPYRKTSRRMPRPHSSSSTRRARLLVPTCSLRDQTFSTAAPGRLVRIPAPPTRAEGIHLRAARHEGGRVGLQYDLGVDRYLHCHSRLPCAFPVLDIVSMSVPSLSFISFLSLSLFFSFFSFLFFSLICRLRTVVCV